MDDKIRMLAEQAGMFKVNFTWGFGHILLEDEQEDLIQKFADLIIKQGRENDRTEEPSPKT
jgi:hypothetical protein